MVNIDWVTPDFQSETDEYFLNDYAREVFQSNGLSFVTEGELLDWVTKGKPVQMEQTEIENSEYNPEKLYEFYGPNYVKSYRDMEQRLLKQGNITLPMPIVVNFGKLFLLAGNRRLNLGWKYTGKVTFWVKDGL